MKFYFNKWGGNNQLSAKNQTGLSDRTATTEWLSQDETPPPWNQVDPDSVEHQSLNKRRGGAEWGGRHLRVSGNAAPSRLEKNKLGRFRVLRTRVPPAGRVQDETQILIYKKQREDPVLFPPVSGGIFK